jgi:hypothetical protein
MLRKSHIIVLALVAAAVAAPLAQAGKPADPLALSILREKGYTPAQIAAMTKVPSPAKPVDPLAVSILRGRGYSPSQIATMTGGSIPVSAPAPRPVDPLAVSYLRSQGLTPSEVVDWTTGACSHEVKAASCFAVFDRNTSDVATASTSTGFAWGDAGIGAAATLGIVLLAMGLGFTLITRGRRQTGQPKHV